MKESIYLNQPTEDQLYEYMFLRDAAKKIDARIKEIKLACKDAGSFCTPNFVCAVYTQEQCRLAGIEEVSHALGRGLLEHHNLINHISFQVVKIAYRSDV